MKIKRIDFTFFITFIISLFLLDSFFHIGRVFESLALIRFGLFGLIIFIPFCYFGLCRNVVICNFFTKSFCLIFIIIFLGYVRAVYLNQNMMIAKEFLSAYIYFFFYPILVMVSKNRTCLVIFLKFLLLFGILLSLSSVLFTVLIIRDSALELKYLYALNKYGLFVLFHSAGHTMRIIWTAIVIQVNSLFISLIFYFISPKLKARLMYVFCLFINVIGIFLTYARGMYVGVIIGLFLCFIFFSRIYDKNIRKRLVHLIFFIAILGTVGIMYIFNKNPDVFYYLLERFMGVGSNADSDSVREIAVEKLNILIMRNPLFGNGIGACIDYRDGRVEMFFKDVISKIGIIGYCALFFPCINMVYVLFKRKKCYNMQSYILMTGITCSLLSVILASITNPYFLTSFGIFTYAFAMSLFSIKSEYMRGVSCLK